ncbi:MAG: ELM1/GtrOC1 family putative glycosyltransferase [Pseudomonadota bacterium]
MSHPCIILATPRKIGHRRQAEAIAHQLTDAVTIVPADMAPARADGHVVIAAGRQALAPAARLSGRARAIVALQPVMLRRSAFDVIWAPAHDRVVPPLPAQKSVRTITAPSMVTCARAAAAAGEVRARFQLQDGPIVGVLVGGPSRAHRFGLSEAQELADRLSALRETFDVQLLATTSGRTPPAVTAHLVERLGAASVFDAAGDPEAGTVLAGLLGLSAAVVVTADSFAMLSDAASVGTPILGWRLPGGKAKFDRFYTALIDHGALRWFDGELSTWDYPPLDAARTVADKIRAHLTG